MSPSGQTIRGSAVGGGRARRDPAAAEDRRVRRARRAHDVERERRGRRRGEVRVAVEQVAAEQAGARGDLGDRGIRRRRLERAGAAAVHELEVGVLAHRRDGARAALEQLGHRARLHPAVHRAVDRAARRTVHDAGDLRLVRHHADEPEARAAATMYAASAPASAGSCTGDRRTPRCPSTGRGPRRIELEAHPDLLAPRRAAARRRRGRAAAASRP